MAAIIAARSKEADRRTTTEEGSHVGCGGRAVLAVVRTAQVAYRVAQREWHQSMREMTAIAHALSAIAHRGNSSFRAQDRRDAAVWAR